MSIAMATKGKKAPKLTKVSDIVGGKIDFQIRTRVLNLWTTPDRFNPNEVGNLHMILLDSQGGKIHASVRKNLLPLYRDQIDEGAVYVFEKLMVAANDPTFKTTQHKYKLNFMCGTTVFKLTDANDIPKTHFEFVSFQEILGSVKEDRLIDVMGHVVERDILKETVKNGKVSKVMDATLQDLEGNRIHCTLWDGYAIQMTNFLEKHDPSVPLVVVIQMCKLKKYFGVMGISNAFYGTKLLFNADIPEVRDYIDGMNVAHVELTQVVSQMTTPIVVPLADDLINTPRMTIEDLLESSEKCLGSVLVRICEFETDVGWFYRACTKCASRITVLHGQTHCDKCKMPRTAIPRFKVHVQVIDNTGSTTFILFDRIVSQNIGKSAKDLVDAIDEANVAGSYPKELDMFVDKRMLFKVEVSDANLYHNWRSYTVKKLTSDNEIIKKFISHHGINLGNDEEEADYVEAVSQLAENNPLETKESADSNSKDESMMSEPELTPTSKTLGKRSADSGCSLDDVKLDEGEESTTKEARIKCDKVEESN